ncbi:TetR/AcrR family transcriptional regulator [Aquimarina addita]|uniref:TetR/AcrR family transcriptional regulator n=1 Tax=Aquimarina addita TaxID=870485 RepID=A0ABP6USF2_9FLAO
MSKADTTRKNILTKAFALIYKNGYQATSIDEIIATTQVTKGALYYHFKNKDEMGLAMIKEILYHSTDATILKPLTNTKDPQSQIYGMIKDLLDNTSFFKIEYGCPIVNLIEEMAPLDTKFARELRKLFIEWRKMIVTYLEEAKEKKTINSTIDSEQVATFILISYSGVRNLGKILGESCYKSYLKELKNYLTVLH